MDLNRLKTFLKVAQYGSFKQVADENFITQRAVSKQMRQLPFHFLSTRHCE